MRVQVFLTNYAPGRFLIPNLKAIEKILDFVYRDSEELLDEE